MTWHIEAYLEPRTSTPRLRRGEVVIFYKDQTLASAGSSTWRRSPTVENYAEVTRIGKVLQQGLTRPSSLATFFDAPDSINDDDLVAILDVVRTPLSTTQLDRLEHTSVRARCEQESAATRVIMQVAPASDGRIEVSFLGGCYYHLARRESTWVVVEVGTIVS
jgi:hypothetical protein